MKSAYKVAAIVAVALTINTTSFAQGKIGYVDSQKLMSEVPDRANAESELQKYAQTLQTQLQLMSKEWEAKMDEYNNLATDTPELIKSTKADELRELEVRIQEFQNIAQEKLKQKESELLEPIIAKVKEAINKVAKAKGYAHVFDTSVGVVLVFPDSNDITTLVKQELGS